VNTEEALDTALDSRRDAGFLQLVAQHLHDAREKLLALLAAGFHKLAHVKRNRRDRRNGSRGLPALRGFSHAQSVRDRRVDVQRLARDLELAIRREMLKRTHVVQPVGELDEDDTNVVDHGQDHLAQVFRLLFFPGGKIDLSDFGDAFDNVRDLLAEFLANIDGGDGGVFDRIVQKPGPRRRPGRASSPLRPTQFPKGERRKVRPKPESDLRVLE